MSLSFKINGHYGGILCNVRSNMNTKHVTKAIHTTFSRQQMPGLLRNQVSRHRQRLF